MESKLTLSSLSMSMRGAKNAPSTIANQSEVTAGTTNRSNSKKKANSTTEVTTEDSSSKADKRKQ